MKCIAVVCVVLFALLAAAFGLKDPVCYLPPDAREIPELKYSYHYHADTNSCKLSVHFGCSGNANSFSSLGECMMKCHDI